MTIDCKKNQEEFEELLRSTKREGIDYVIEDLEKDGFFQAPASAGHHLNVAGGPCPHNPHTLRAGLMVWEGLKTLDPASANEVSRESVIIATLLHDVCKTDIYHRTVKKRRDKLGQWVDTEGYNVNYKHFPMGHGEKSVIMLLLSGLDLHDDEMLAIRWHMGAWGINMNSYEDQRCYDTARTLHPLCCIVQSADGIAASIMETSAEDLENV